MMYLKPLIDNFTSNQIFKSSRTCTYPYTILSHPFMHEAALNHEVPTSIDHCIVIIDVSVVRTIASRGLITIYMH